MNRPNFKIFNKTVTKDKNNNRILSEGRKSVVNITNDNRSNKNLPYDFFILGKLFRENNGLRKPKIFFTKITKSEICAIQSNLNLNKHSAISNPLIISRYILYKLSENSNKILDHISLDKLNKLKSDKDPLKIVDEIKEPNKTIFLWFLDLIVDVIMNREHNNISKDKLCKLLSKYMRNIDYKEEDEVEVVKTIDILLSRAIERIIWNKNRKIELSESKTIKNDDILEKLINMEKHLIALNGLKEVSIFRASPDSKETYKAILIFESKNKEKYSEITSPHVVARCIKIWLQYMGFKKYMIHFQNTQLKKEKDKKSVWKKFFTLKKEYEIKDIPCKYFFSFIKYDKLINVNTLEDVKQLLILKKRKKIVFDWAINLFARVAMHSEINKMNVKNICIVLAPILFDYTAFFESKNFSILSNKAAYSLELLINQELNKLKLESEIKVTRESSFVWIPVENNVEIAYEEKVVVESTSRKLIYKDKDPNFNKKTTVHISDEIVQFDIKDLENINNNNDLYDIKYLSKPFVLRLLKNRFYNKNYYTKIVDILLYINPYTKQEINKELALKYSQDENDNLKPHIFFIAKNAFSNLLDNKNSMIIIHGNSGAGKTELMNQCLYYYTNLYKLSNDSLNNIKYVEPIIETFGNAETANNINSSRFIRYISIFFNDNYSIYNIKIKTILLEKNRLHQRKNNENNFHIFYLLLNNLSIEEKAALKMKDHQKYYYISDYKKNNKDKVKYDRLIDSMYKLNFDEMTIKNIFKMIAIILHIGNIEFRSNENSDCLVNNIENLNLICELLMINNNTFINCLTKKELVVPRKSTIYYYRTIKQAQINKNDLAVYLYDSLFKYIIQHINHYVNHSIKSNNKCVSILDMFGFENIVENSLDQLCINYCNEKMQQFFLEDIIENNLKLNDKDYYNEVLHLFEKKNEGIFDLIDESLTLSRMNDLNLVIRINVIHKDSHKYVPLYHKHSSFLIKHYSSDVEYDTKNFIVENGGKLNRRMINLIKSSSWKFLIDVAGCCEEEQKLTTSQTVKQEIDNLILMATSTNNHYVKCIKSNNKKLKNKFQEPIILEQLNGYKIFETNRFFKETYPYCFNLKEFNSKYSKLITIEGDNLSEREKAKSIVKKISQKTYKIGNSKIILRKTDSSLFNIDKTEIKKDIPLKNKEKCEDKNIQTNSNMISDTNVYNFKKDSDD